MFLRTLRKVKAMPPPMIISSTLSSMLLISWILSLTLALQWQQEAAHAFALKTQSRLCAHVKDKISPQSCSAHFHVHCLNSLSRVSNCLKTRERERERKYAGVITANQSQPMNTKGRQAQRITVGENNLTIHLLCDPLVFDSPLTSQKDTISDSDLIPKHKHALKHLCYGLRSVLLSLFVVRYASRTGSKQDTIAHAARILNEISWIYSCPVTHAFSTVGQAQQDTGSSDRLVRQDHQRTAAPV